MGYCGGMGRYFVVNERCSVVMGRCCGFMGICFGVMGICCGVMGGCGVMGMLLCHGKCYGVIEYVVLSWEDVVVSLEDVEVLWEYVESWKICCDVI